MIVGEDIQAPFDAFELVRALRGAHEWFRYQWSGESVSAALGDHLFHLAIADFKAADRDGRVKRSALTTTEFEGLFKNLPSEEEGSPTAAFGKEKSRETFASAWRDLDEGKLQHFEYFFQLDEDEWFRFQFRIEDHQVPRVRRLGRFLSVKYQACASEDVPGRFKTIRPGLVEERPQPKLTLPRYPSPEFLGRDDDLRCIRRFIRSGAEIPIIAIDGMPGVGKTDLALAAALLLRYRYDEILYLEFGRFGTDRTAEEQGGELLEKAIGLLEDAFEPGQARPAFSASSLRERYLSLLEGRNVIVICDDVESGSLVEQFAPPIGSAMLVVSSAAVALRGVTDRLYLEPLKLADAISLLGRHSHGRISGTVPGEIFLWTAPRWCSQLP